MTKPLSTEERFRVTPNEDKALKSLFPLEVTLLKPSSFFLHNSSKDLNSGFFESLYLQLAVHGELIDDYT